MRFSVISVAAAVCLIAGIQAAPTPQGGAPGLPAANVGTAVTGLKAKVEEITSGGTGGGAGAGGGAGSATGTTASSSGGSSSLDGPSVAGNVAGAVPGLKTIFTGPGRKRSEQAGVTGAESSTDTSTGAGTNTQADAATQAGQGTDTGASTKGGNVVEKAVGTVQKVAANPNNAASASNVVAPAKDAVQKTAGKLTGSGAQTGLAGGAVSKLSGTGLT
ncbi:hypothetical protein INT45_004807 [Circinella minor]|uniref:Uncharacterized protein n=1 Tax=Circinella minor TaxID=1195481 RepID=A0A8H7RRC8_9FUNG|nr:hypothetical protein INT45_004807 [Circinella minor]